MPTITQQQKINQFRELVASLHSSAVMYPDSFFAEWNNKNCSEKLEKTLKEWGRDDRRYLRPCEATNTIGIRERIRFYRELPACVERLVDHYLIPKIKLESDDEEFLSLRISGSTPSGILSAASIIARVPTQGLDQSHLRVRDLIYQRLVANLSKKTGTDISDVEGTFESIKMLSPTKCLVTFRSNEYQKNDETKQAHLTLSGKYPKLVARLDPLLTEAELETASRGCGRAIQQAQTEGQWKAVFKDQPITGDQITTALEKCCRDLSDVQGATPTIQELYTIVYPLLPNEEEAPTSSIIRCKRDLQACHQKHFTALREADVLPMLKPYVAATKQKGYNDVIELLRQIEEGFAMNQPIGALAEAIEVQKSKLEGVGGRPSRTLYAELTLAKLLVTCECTALLRARVEQRFPNGICLRSTNVGEAVAAILLSKLLKMDAQAILEVENGETEEDRRAAYSRLNNFHRVRTLFDTVEESMERWRNMITANPGENGQDQQAIVVDEDTDGGNGEDVAPIADAQQNPGEVPAGAAANAGQPEPVGQVVGGNPPPNGAEPQDNVA